MYILCINDIIVIMKTKQHYILFNRPYKENTKEAVFRSQNITGFNIQIVEHIVKDF